ncbi:ferritin family protein [bacterium]|nr:ferritin family protein [bacterium]
MTPSYSGSEILQMAVELEEMGKRFYERVFDEVKDKKTRSVFRYLADEEVKHKALFQKMLRSADSESFSGPYDPTEMMLYFKSLVGQKIFPDAESADFASGALNDPRIAIRIALSLEKDAILFFHEMQTVTAEGDRTLVEGVIAEERNHIRRILALKAELGI